jgi:phytoene desaturase
MSRPLDVVVIGAGLGGLAAAAHLIKAGHTVTIVERESIPGGRAGMITEAGFRLDNGPTVLTMPNLLADAFAAAGAEMADFVTIKPVDPMYRAVYADGSTLHVRHGREAMTDEIRQFANAHEAEAFGRFCDWLEQLYRVEMAHFIDANFDSPLDLVKPWRAGLELVKLGGFGKLGKKVASFFDDERLQRIFSFQAMYAGLAPYEAREFADAFRRQNEATLQALLPHFRDQEKTVAIAKSGRQELEENLRRDREARNSAQGAGSWGDDAGRQ